MPTTKSERMLDYVPITGPGVEALERRKEHNDNAPVTAEKLRASVDKVKRGIFDGIKMLTSSALQRIQKQ
jgi:hypothetical protein